MNTKVAINFIEGDDHLHAGLILGLRPANKRRRYKNKRRLSLAERKPRLSPVYSLLCAAKPWVSSLNDRKSTVD